MIHIYCGDGKGKTTAACGLAVRSAGQSRRVVFSQFLKNDTSGEIASLRSLGILTLHTETPATFTWKMNGEQLEKTRAAAQNLFERVVSAAQEADLVVMDELLWAYRYGMIDKSALLEFLATARAEVVLTGRGEVPEELLELADYVSEIRKIKHPFDRGVKGRRGVEF